MKNACQQIIGIAYYSMMIPAISGCTTQASPAPDAAHQIEDDGSGVKEIDIPVLDERNKVGLQADILISLMGANFNYKRKNNDDAHCSSMKNNTVRRLLRQ